MFKSLKPPRDEEAERLERQRVEKLKQTALHMLDAAVARHDDAMEAGNYEMAGAHAETAAWWWGALTGRNTE